MAASTDQLNITAKVFCAELPLADESTALLKDELSVPEFLNVLIEHQRWIDAVQLLTRMMPPREGVWWAVQCVASSLTPEARPQELAALKAAETWVTDMTEVSRYAAFEAAKKARLGSSANCAAMAAFLSGPSLAPLGSDLVPPPPDFPAQMVAGTVMAAGFSAGHEQSPAKLSYFLGQGKALYEQVTASST